MAENKKPLFSGKVAFTLYDTYGFPLDLTQSILRDKNIEVNVAEFEEEMSEQKKRAKEAWAGSGDVKNNKIYFEIKEKISPTEFVGYEKNTAMGKILALIKNNQQVQEVKAGDEFEFFVDKTPFYGECGGQVGDTGIAIQIGENKVIPLPFTNVEIFDTKRPFNNYFLHKAKIETGSLKVGDFLSLSINTERRNKIKANHSATHLLQYALRSIFGETLMQKGSSVDENRLRFDFTSNKAISKENIKKVEDIVNELIFENSEVKTKIMPLEEAKKYGAMALFNEKYEDDVRVLFIGEKSIESDKQQNYLNKNTLESVSESLHLLNQSSLKTNCSVELCGGTHVFKTKEIGLFKIVSEEAISSGVRRIEAVTGLKAIEFMNNFQNIVETLKHNLQIDKNNLIEKIESINENYKKIKKELDSIKKSNLANMDFTEENNNNIVFAYNILTDINPKDVKGVFIDIQNKKYKENSILLSIVKFDNKLSIILGVSKDLNEKIKANELIKELTEIAGGKGGGGQPWFAMGGANDDDNKKTLDNVLGKVKENINKI